MEGKKGGRIGENKRGREAAHIQASTLAHTIVMEL